MNLNIIPQPKKKTVSSGSVNIGSITADNRFGGAADAFEQYLELLSIKRGTVGIYAKFNDSIHGEAYILDVTSASITLAASTAEGINNAFATLLQLAVANEGNVPCVRIEDEPDCKYRGIMIDAARVWHPLDYLLRYVDLCRYYKFSYLHIHFTDTQSYTLPCKAFPKLPTKGRRYTYEQIKELNAYAHARGVKIMPEIDVPGHCDPFLTAYPEIFGHNGIIGFHKEVFDAFDKIIAELCEMFPYSDKIHIGGDEADIKQWLGCERCREYAAECGIPCDGDERLSSERMLAMFVAKLSQTVLSHDKTPVVWEGFCKEVNYLVPRDTEVFSWENFYQPTPELIEAGYTLINGSWNPNYVVVGAVMWSIKECFDWDIFSFKPVHPGSPYIGKMLKVPEYGKMIGGQLLSWGDYGAISDNPQRHIITEFEKVSERAPATAENTWNVSKAVTFDEFEASRRLQSGTVSRLFNMKLLQTKRLVLRPFTPKDEEDVIALIGSDEFSNDAKSFIREMREEEVHQPRNAYDFAIEYGGAVIGSCGLTLLSGNKEASAGWMITESYRNTHYATEAGEALLKFGFEYLGLHRITAECLADNIASYKVMENIGMRREAHFLKNKEITADGKTTWADSYKYAILKEEFHA